MCGICGEWNLDPNTGDVCLSGIKRMCDALRHRGPDGEGLYLQAPGRRTILLGQNAKSGFGRSRGRIGLGHRRLSIIDLKTGDQPLHNEDRSVWIVFNGEIYNYRDLRVQLETRGHHFVSQSDTETIVHLYEEQGVSCLQHLKGIFGFAIWDEKQEQLFLARDRLGVKPLFYAWDGKRLLFASEIKAILRVLPEPEIDLEALHNYLSLNYIPGPRTIYQKIWSLPPGHLLIANHNGIRVEQYWDLHDSYLKSGENHRWSRKEHVAEELLEKLRNVVTSQMISDVPLGVFLSGGLDSSIIVALMSEVTHHPINTFSIGFKEKTFNELPAAGLVASQFGTHHTELMLEPNICDVLPEIVESFDQPFADSSAIPTFYLSQLARGKVTVALGGDGGDEVFAGYDTYVATKLAGFYQRVPPFIRNYIIKPLVTRLPTSEAKVSFDYKAKRFVEGAGLPLDQAHFWWKVIFSEDAKVELYREGYPYFLHDSFRVFAEHFKKRSDGELLDGLQYADLKLYLPDDILVKVDRMSMAHSLEVRVPFLDHEIVEFVTSLPSCFRMNGFAKKFILKKAVKDLLPSRTVHGRKRGFNVPIGRWLKLELRELQGISRFNEPSPLGKPVSQD